MDPLSIVVASTTLTKLCPQVILSLKVWIGEVSTIDDIVSAFCGEIRCLENTLEALQAKLNEPSMREAVRAVDVTAGGRLWTQVERSMSDCVTTLESLDNILKGLSRPEGNLFRRSVKQFRLSLESGKIATLRQRIVFFTTTLDLPVQMISLSLQVEQRESNESNHQLTLHKIDLLVRSVRDLESSLRSQSIFHPDLDRTEEEAKMYENMESCAGVAKDFASKASTAGSSERNVPMERGGNSARRRVRRRAPDPPVGDPIDLGFSENSFHEAAVPTGPNAEELATNASVHAPGSRRNHPLSESSVSQQLSGRSISGETADTSLSSLHPEELITEEDDSDFESDVVTKLLERGRLNYERGYYAKAERVFREVLRNEPETSSGGNAALSIGDIKFMFAVSLFKTRNLAEAEVILRQMVESVPKPVNLQDLAVFHLLAKTLMQAGKAEQAERFCRSAAAGRRRSLGKNHSSYHETMNLLARIRRKQGQEETALAIEEHLRDVGSVEAENEMESAIMPARIAGLQTLNGSYGSPSTQLEGSMLRNAQLRRFYELAEAFKKLDGNGKTRGASLALQLLSEYPGMQDICSARTHELSDNVLHGQHGLGLTGSGYGCTVLHCFAMNKVLYKEEAEYLLENGADVDASCTNSTGQRGTTALMLATERGHLDLVRLLLDNRASIVKTDSMLNRPLHYAARANHAEINILLLRKGADLEARNSKAETPLLSAVIVSAPTATKCLLDAGANVEARTNRYMGKHLKPVVKREKKAPNSSAVGNASNLPNLFRRRLTSRVPTKSILPARRASAGGTISNTRAPSGASPSTGLGTSTGGEFPRNPLTLNATSPHRLLPMLRDGYDAGYYDESGYYNADSSYGSYGGTNDYHREFDTVSDAQAPANDSPRNEFTALHIAADIGNEEIIKLLLAARADPSANSTVGTPLHIAAASGSLMIVRHLLEARANTEIGLQHTNFTAVHVIAGRGHIEIMELLLDNGANISADSKEGIALHIAVTGHRTSMVKYLLSHGINPDGEGPGIATREKPLLVAARHDYTDIARHLLDRGAIREVLDKNGLTPLHHCASNGHNDTLRVLLERGANTEARSPGGATALRKAADAGHAATCAALVEKSAEINAIDNHCSTALMAAATHGHTKVVKVLVKGGANVKIRDLRNRTAMDYAKDYHSRNYNPEIVDEISAATPRWWRSSR